MRIQDRDLVAFLGDSITEHLVAVSDPLETQSDDLPAIGSQVRVQRYEHRGWTATLAARIAISYPERRIRYLNAGIAGHSSRQMLARLDADVLRHRPQWLLLSAGVVDVRRHFQPDRQSEVVPLPEYVANLTELVSRSLSSGARVILLEPTPHAAPVARAQASVTLQEVHAHTRLYAQAMAQVAAATGVDFVPLFAALLSTQERLPADTSLYADDVHLNARGDLLYSQLVFQALDSP
jgi:lysophospholipase L1-like esterase